MSTRDLGRWTVSQRVRASAASCTPSLSPICFASCAAWGKLHTVSEPEPCNGQLAREGARLAAGAERGCPLPLLHARPRGSSVSRCTSPSPPESHRPHPLPWRLCLQPRRDAKRRHCLFEDRCNSRVYLSPYSLSARPAQFMASVGTWGPSRRRRRPALCGQQGRIFYQPAWHVTLSIHSVSSDASAVCVAPPAPPVPAPVSPEGKESRWEEGGSQPP